jgi:hypothetical protein
VAFSLRDLSERVLVEQVFGKFQAERFRLALETLAERRKDARKSGRVLGPRPEVSFVRDVSTPPRKAEESGKWISRSWGQLEMFDGEVAAM